MLIRPDILQLIASQTSDIQSIVDGAIKSAVSQKNNTLLKEVNSGQEGNSDLKKIVSTLKQNYYTYQYSVGYLEFLLDESILQGYLASNSTIYYPTFYIRSNCLFFAMS